MPEYSRTNNILTAQPGLSVFACTPRHSLVAPYWHQDHDLFATSIHSSPFIAAPRQVTMPVRTRRQAAQPFRFLDLPLEIKQCMEEIANPARNLTPPSISLVIKTVPVALRAACRQVNRELSDNFRRKLKYISRESLRLIVDAPSLRHVFGWCWQFCLLLHIDEEQFAIRRLPSLTKEYRLDLADTDGSAYPWKGLRVVPGTREYNEIFEFVHRCARSIEARSPPIRRVAVLVQPHICCWLDIETARKYCRSNFWSDSNGDCLNIEYSVSIKTHEQMRNRHLFVPISHDKIETS